MELVQVGRRSIPVVAQKHARLRHYLGAEDFQKVLSKSYGHETYRILSVLVPAIPNGVRDINDPSRFAVQPFPEWEWEGYGSEEAWKNNEYDEELDESPTGAEIVDLFEKSLMVNGANRLGNLLNLVRSGATLVEAQSTANSPVSPGGNGASISTTTGTPAQT